MRILVTDGMDANAMQQLREEGYEIVEQFHEPPQLGYVLRDFDGVVIRSATKIREPQIDAARGSRLKFIIRAGVGVDNIAVDYAREAGIEVRNTPNASSNAVAELAIALLFSCARNVSVAGHTMREQKWEKKAYSKGFEVSGKTMGVIGYGRIGRLVGTKAQALGMQVFTGPNQAGTVSFLPGTDCEEAAQQLAKQGIAVRAGLHCAPYAHDSAGTVQTGTVRVSYGFHASNAQTDAFLRAASKLPPFRK
jgi:lactate dehydrogenase-like 2-hydroxyacid dehydrogenase